MMWNKRVALIILCFILFIPCVKNIVYGNVENNRTLIVYDKNLNFGYTEDVVLSIKELLYHFTDNVIQIGLDAIEDKNFSNRNINNYNSIVVIGLDTESDFKHLSTVLKGFNGNVLWIGYGVNDYVSQMTRGSLQKPFQICRDVYSYRNVSYKTVIEELGVKRGFPSVEVYSNNVDIKSYVSNDRTNNPLALRFNNLWYMSRVDVSSDIFFILADLLYEFYETESNDRDRIYIRLEDIHPMADLNKLIAIGEYLHKKNIPFMMALIPVYINNDNGTMITISDVPKFGEVIRYMVDLGGSVVLHGYTHQYIGYESGEGYEFWNGVDNKPLDLDINEWIDQRIPKALDECVDNGIYPLAFEVPHYAISQEGYRGLASYFSVIIGHLQNTDASFNTTIFPYELYNTDYGFDLIPENIGFFDPQNPLNMQNIKGNLERLKLVDGSLGGFFYHPYLGLNGLKEAIELIDDYGLEYYDLSKIRAEVSWDNNQISVSKGKMVVSLKQDIEDTQEKGPNWFGISIDALILMLGLIIVANTLIYLVFKHRHRKRLDK